MTCFHPFRFILFFVFFSFFRFSSFFFSLFLVIEWISCTIPQFCLSFSRERRLNFGSTETISGFISIVNYLDHDTFYFSPLSMLYNERIFKANKKRKKITKYISFNHHINHNLWLKCMNYANILSMCIEAWRHF